MKGWSGVQGFEGSVRSRHQGRRGRYGIYSSLLEKFVGIGIGQRPGADAQEPFRAHRIAARRFRVPAMCIPAQAGRPCRLRNRLESVCTAQRGRYFAIRTVDELCAVQVSALIVGYGLEDSSTAFGRELPVVDLPGS